MRILLIDTMAGFLDFSLRAEAQGHEIRWFNPWTGPDGVINTGRGLINRVKDWRSSMRWADLILLADNAKYLRDLEPYRQQGYPIFGCNVACRDWELIRDVGQQVMEDAGITCLTSIRFDNYDDGIAYVKSRPTERLVCKPIGDAPKDLSYVSKSSQDLIFMLQHWKRHLSKPYPYIFQTFSPGIEMAVGAWCGPNGFTSFCLENFEFKKLMNDEKGVNTGEMGTVMKYCHFSESRLAQQMLLPVEAALIRNGYTGYIDVSVIIDKQGQPNPMEFTCRPGWPLFQIQQVLHPDTADWMKDLLNGRDTFAPHTDIALGVVVAIPDFPYGKIKAENCCNFPVWGITPKNRYWIHPLEMQAGKAPVLEDGKLTEKSALVTAGSYVLVVSGAGDTVRQAKDAAYSHLSELEIPNSPMYRTDIGARLEGQLAELQSLGYATTWKW